MNKTPLIFSVLSFYKNDDQTYRCDSHLVAAFTSAEAEYLIKEKESYSIKDCVSFINTDRYMSNHPTQIRMFSTRLTADDHVSEMEFQRWIHVMTRHSFNDGERMPPTFRQI